MDLKTLQNNIDSEALGNIINIILSLKKTKQTDEVIIFTLQQYGYTDTSISSALDYVNKNIKKLEKQDMIKENNTFSLVDIFNKAQTLKAQLRNYLLDEALSFVSQNAISVIDRNFDFMKCQIIEQISNGTISEDKSELGIAYKYAVVESLYTSLSKYNVEEVQSFVKELLNLYEEHKYEFEAARIINESSNKTQFFKGQENLVNDMTKFLTESELSEAEFVEILENNSWSNRCQELLCAIESSKEPKEHVYDTFNVYESISPVTTIGNKMIVNLFGFNYSYDGKTFEEFSEDVTDTKYNNVLEGLSVMTYNPTEKTLTYFSKYGKNLEFDLNESIVRIGQLEFKLDSILEFTSAIQSLNVFNNKNDYNKVMKLLESRDIINEIDNCKTIVPNNNLGRVAHIFESNNGTTVLFVDKNNISKELFNLKSKLVESVAEKLNCKVDALFETEIKKEDQTKYERECEIAEIQKTLKFLGEKRNEFANLLAKGEDSRINETIKLIDDEIVLFEKKMQKLI